MHPYACFVFQIKLKNIDVPSLFDAQLCHNKDLENNFLCLNLSGNRGGLQQNMWFCKLQSLLHVQHENKVLNPGLSVQRIATNF